MRRIALGLVAAIMGAALLSWTWKTTSKIKSSAHWPTTPGQVISSTVARDSSRIRGGGYNHYYDAQIRYQYTLNGRQYTSNVLTFGMRNNFSDSISAAQKTGTLPVGSSVPVYFDPRDPASACLEAGVVPKQFSVIGWSAAAFLFAGLVSIISGIIYLRRRLREAF